MWLTIGQHCLQTLSEHSKVLLSTNTLAYFSGASMTLARVYSLVCSQQVRLGAFLVPIGQSSLQILDWHRSLVEDKHSSLFCQRIKGLSKTLIACQLLASQAMCLPISQSSLEIDCDTKSLLRTNNLAYFELAPITSKVYSLVCSELVKVIQPCLLTLDKYSKVLLSTNTLVYLEGASMTLARVYSLVFCWDIKTDESCLKTLGQHSKVLLITNTLVYFEGASITSKTLLASLLFAS